MDKGYSRQITLLTEQVKKSDQLIALQDEALALAQQQAEDRTSETTPDSSGTSSEADQTASDSTELVTTKTEDVTKEELGDHNSQVIKTGVIDNLAESEEEAFEMIRRFLSYMPTSVWKKPERINVDDDPNRRDEELLSIIPRRSKRRYDPYKILNHVMDHDSFFEIALNFTFVPGLRIVGSFLFLKNNLLGVLPIIFQPPGLSTGYIPV